ncbi:FAD-dependent oxidoreductase [Rhodococcus pyridinivorans]|uniref:FAD-dependent oxidoreductase n=1 Tax=Rhodococcus pyridinivorans TaxID=103816 RepID=UPI0035573139
MFDKPVAGHGSRMAISGTPHFTAPASIAPLRFDIYDPLSLQESLTAAFSLGGSIPPPELAVFIRKLVMFLTNSLERRNGQWEHETWAQTLEADGKSKGYLEILVSALTRQLVSALTRQLVSALTRQLVAAMPAERAVSLWRGDFAQRYGDGSAHDCLSVDISDWDTPGILYGRTAKQCTPEEIAREVWAQMSACLEDGTGAIDDNDIASWFLDPGVKWGAGGVTNDTPLVINTAGSLANRSEAHTAIPNLFLAGDYVRNDIDLATMEGANESARAAVGALLQTAGSPAAPPALYKLHEPPELEPLRRINADRYRAGQPHMLA